MAFRAMPVAFWLDEITSAGLVAQPDANMPKVAVIPAMAEILAKADEVDGNADGDGDNDDGVDDGLRVGRPRHVAQFTARVFQVLYDTSRHSAVLVTISAILKPPPGG